MWCLLYVSIVSVIVLDQPSPGLHRASRCLMGWSMTSHHGSSRAILAPNCMSPMHGERWSWRSSVMFSVHFVRLRLFVRPHQTSSLDILWYPQSIYRIYIIHYRIYIIHYHSISIFVVKTNPVNHWCVDVRSWRGRPWRSRVETRAAAVSWRSHRFSHSSAPGEVTVWGHGESRNLWCSFHINIFTLKASETDNIWQLKPNTWRCQATPGMGMDQYLLIPFLGDEHP